MVQVLSSGGRGCLGEGRLGVPGPSLGVQVLAVFSFPRENLSSKKSEKTLEAPDILLPDIRGLLISPLDLPCAFYSQHEVSCCIMGTGPASGGEAFSIAACQKHVWKNMREAITHRACEGFVRALRKGYPKDPIVVKMLRVVNSLRVVDSLSHCDIYYRSAPRADTVFLGFTGIYLSKEGSQRSEYGGGGWKNTTE